MRWQTAAVVVFILAAVAYCISLPDRDTLLEQFGKERWACSDMVPGKSVLRSVGWVSGRSALSVMISSRSEISFLGLSCRSRKGLCIPFDGGWRLVALSSEGAGEPLAVHFGRGVSAGKSDGEWFENREIESSFTLARLTGNTGAAAVGIFDQGDRATVKVYGEGTKLLASENVSLAGFDEAMAACHF